MIRRVFFAYLYKSDCYTESWTFSSFALQSNILIIEYMNKAIKYIFIALFSLIGLSEVSKKNSRFLVLNCIVFVFCISISFGCKCQKNSIPLDTALGISPDSYYEVITDTTNIDWLEEIPVFHYWKEIPDEEYLFNSPSTEQIAYWQSMCEKENPSDSVMRSFVQKDCRNMNHYVTIYDFMDVWAQQNPYGSDDAFTLWRLEQYNMEAYSPDSEFDRFLCLKSIIQSLCCYDAQFQFELNFKAGMEGRLQEFYDRTILREATQHSQPQLSKALETENLAWEEYHAQLDSTFRIIDGEINGLVGSAWPMAISGILYDDARIREISLADFCFALTNSLDYELEKHTEITEDKVIQEYRRFMNSLEEDEFAYPLYQRKKVLALEMNAWNKWMRSREDVSSLLSGLVKECYDNSTNNVRRMKLIMLKNRYNGYGITSGDVMSCLIPYTASDAELNGPSFDEIWKSN